MRLCLEAGVLDYESALKAIPPRIIDGWMAFDRIEGISRDNFRTAVQTASTISAMSADAMTSRDIINIIKSTLHLLNNDDVFDEVHQMEFVEPMSPEEEARREVAQLRSL